jgi:LuxR family transcriptional regulator, maltose regulon positive regulatory protein
MDSAARWGPSPEQDEDSAGAFVGETETPPSVSDVNRDTRLEREPHRGPVPSAGIDTPAGLLGVEGRAVPPRLPARLAGRSAAFRRLDRMAAVTVVEALPGFGKTALVAEWAGTKRAEGARVVWLRASRELDHVPTMLTRVRDALAQVGAIRETAGAAYDDARWIDELAMSAVPVIVAVDDAHLLRDRAVADALLLVASIAHPLHVVVCCDTEHHFHDTAARHALETNVLQGRDLSITAAELPAFAAAWGHQLDPEAASVLHELVGGWLLPLRLVLDATPRLSASFATHVAHQFLIDRVLPGTIDNADLSLAMRFAVPAELDSALASAMVLDGADDDAPQAAGERAAGSLERQGLLWRQPRNDGAAVWRFPRLVRRTLLEHFEQTRPDEARAVHRVVARELAQRRSARTNELLRHARAACDWALLEQLWSDRGWSLAGGDPAAFEFAYAALPKAATQELGSLVLAGSLGDALRGLADDTDWMQRVEALMRRYMETGTDFLRQQQPPRRHQQRAEALTAAMIGRRTDGHLVDALRLAGEAERELERARAAGPGRSRSSQVAWFWLQNAITQLLGGRYSTALEAGSVSYQTSPNSLVGSGASGLLAAMHALSGDADHTRRWLAAHQAIDVSGHWAAGLAELPARLARAMLALDRLDAEAAESELEGTALGSEASGLWPLILTVHVRHAVLFGDPAAMLPRLDHLGRVLDRHLRHRDGVGRTAFDRCSVELMLALGEVNRVQARIGDGHDVPPWLVVPAARFHLMTGDDRRAARIASAGAWRGLHARDQAQLLMIKALALHRLGRHGESRVSVRRAHALARDSGNVEPLLTLPADLRGEMLADARVALDADTQARLDRMRSIYPDRADLVLLSPRELEVLRQLRHSDSVAALARRLSVSVNTVKKQLVSLYAKLDVHDRSSALLRAERLGLLERPAGQDTA